MSDCVSDFPTTLESTFLYEGARFAGHFPQHVVIPGAALVDRVVIAVEQATRRQVIGLKQVKWMAAASPGSTLILRGSVTDSLLSFELFAGTRVTCVGSLSLEPLA
ncbi:hypothetical protein FVQ98_08395 [Ottowia sp. GY511]|uniref:ApeI dehydratase-like domain-containing protein n=1 Tax=Ottowia flava TaxID=2675430 RepID=A0ABW4KMR8_9BURK|nr:hypothetical protein [Ottowia sp. GY511]TXK29532.1 hypothetical protein FVQ98_08395 [Ottowia sp. GY511]